MCKKSVLISILSCLFLFAACGQVAPTTENDVKQELETKVAKTEENIETQELEEATEVPVNTKEEENFYRSEDGIDPLRAIHRCVSDGENVFLAYNEPDIYVMPMGAEEHTPVNIANSEGMKVCHISIDANGRLHLLVAGQNYDEWYIWRLDEEYQIDKIMDISSYYETKHIPNWFLVDKDGTYYFQWTIDRSGIIIDCEGKMKYRTTPESLGLGWIYEAAVGKDGYIYLVYSNGEEQLEIGRLDVENGSIKEDSSLSFPGNETFAAMSAGTDTNLLLFSPNSGVWAYDSEKGMLENRVTLSYIDFGNGMEYWPLTFLPDGRLLLLGRTVNVESTEGAELLMKYIPAGR